MIKLTNYEFREEFDDLGGDNGGGAIETTEAPVEGDPGVGASPEPQRYTLEEFQQMQSTFQQNQPQVEPQKEYSEEELNELLKVYNPDMGLAQRLFGEYATEDHVTALQEMVKGIVTHLTTVQGYASNALRNQLSEQFRPALDSVEEQKISSFASGLASRYPALNGKEQLIRQTVDNLRAQGVRAQSAEEAERLILGHVEQMAKAFDPSFSFHGQPQQQQNNGTMPQMANMGSGGSGGGAGASSASSASKKPAWDVF